MKTKRDGTKVYTTDFIVDKIEFLSKKEEQQEQGKKKHSLTISPDDDVFQPVDDEDIPF